MPREDWRDREDERRRRWSADERHRDDFGQADYSQDYAYDPRHRTGYRAEEDIRPRTDDYGQADYTTDWAYDPERGRPYRRHAGERDWHGDDRREVHGQGSRSWMDRAGDFFGGRSRDDGDRRYEERRPDERRHLDDRHEARRYEDERDMRRRRRDGPSDRVLWAVIMERLERERRLDLSDVDVDVRDGEVTLNGTVRRKTDKRRIEDLADVDGVHHVQNNLRIREDRRWTFL